VPDIQEGMIRKRTRVLVLGGGFAGVYAAQHLEKAIGRRDDVEVALVSKENYFVFQPMLPEVISGSIGLTDTVSPLRRLLSRTEIHVREIESIDLERKVVTTSADCAACRSTPCLSRTSPTRCSYVAG